MSLQQNPLERAQPHGSPGLAIETPAFGRSDLVLMTRKIVRQMLCAWGAVERERFVTGDPTAVPQADWLESGTRGGNRKDPSDIPGVVQAWMDVDAQIGKRRPVLRSALLHVYRDGWELETVSVVYTLSDGSQTEPMSHEAPAPVQAVRAETQHQRTWKRHFFTAGDLPSVLGCDRHELMVSALDGTGWSASHFVRALVRDFERELEKDRNLKELAIANLGRGIDPGWI